MALVPPPAPGAIPVLGHSWALLRQREQFFVRARDGSPVATLRLGSRVVYLVNDLDLIRRILHTDAGRYDRGELFARMRPYIGDNVVLADGAKHRMLRRIYRPAFTRTAVDATVDGLAGLVRAHVGAWAPGAHDDLHGELYDLVLAMGGRVFFPAGLGEATMRAVSEAIPGLVQGLFLRVISPSDRLERLPLPINHRFVSSTARLTAISDTLLQQCRDSAELGDDLVSRLLAARNPADGEPLGDEQIRAELLALVLASSVTVAATLGWCCHFLGSHPELQDTMRREVDQVLGGRACTLADLERLEFTRAVVKESLRCRPPLHFLSREPKEDVDLAGYTVPAGSTVVFSLHALQNDPRHFPRPELFDPHRWLDPEGGRTDPEAFLPFALGMHACFGEHLAMNNAVLVLATIAQNWTLAPAPGTRREPRAGAVLSPGPVPMVLTPRTGPRPDSAPSPQTRPTSGHGQPSTCPWGAPGGAARPH
ncbi:cytochrome P450 [Streptomyces sp. NPDC058548]|uniref:cytochrome P450 n=1 Tax=unclassified Streptomyces TaxID=2593676 RepID=UPI003663CB27